MLISMPNMPSALTGGGTGSPMAGAKGLIAQQALGKVAGMAGLGVNPAGIGLQAAGMLGKAGIDYFSKQEDGRINVNAQTGKGAISGAVTGAQIGSFIPGVGTVGGAAIGGLCC